MQTYLKMGPKSFFISTSIFFVLTIAGIYSQAIRSPLTTTPDDSDPRVSLYAQRAQIWDKMGNYQKALDDVTRAINLDSEKSSYCLNSENASYYNQRAEVYEKLGKKDLAWTDRQIAERILLVPPPFTQICLPAEGGIQQ